MSEHSVLQAGGLAASQASGEGVCGGAVALMNCEIAPGPCLSSVLPDILPLPLRVVADIGEEEDQKE